jgi:hypothetical protein
MPERRAERRSPGSPTSGSPTFAGKTTQLDHGVDTGWQYDGIGSSATAPAVAASGDRVAYAVPRPNMPGHADASAIIVRSLPDGRVVRRLDRDGYVPQVGVWKQALMFREAVGGAEPESADPSAATLYVASSDDQDPFPFERRVSAATIGDGGVPGNDRVAWVSSEVGAVGIRIAPVTTGTPTLVQPALWGGGSVTPVGAGAPALVGDGAAWRTVFTDAYGDELVDVNVWDPGWATGRVVPMLGSPDSLATSDGRLLVVGLGTPAFANTPAGAVPASALFGTQVADGSAPSTAPSPSPGPVDMLMAESLAGARFDHAYGSNSGLPSVQDTKLVDLGDVWRVTFTASLADSQGASIGTATMTVEVDKATGVATVVASSLQ